MSKRINPSQFAADALEDRRLLSATIDVRVAGGGKTAIVESVGDVVELEVWGIVTGSNETGIDDDLRIAVGSFLSSGNGVKGTLSARRIAPFNAPQSSNGIQRDLDKDGDLDVGSNNDASDRGFFAARTLQAGAGLVDGRSRFAKIGELVFTVTSLSPAGKAQINFRRRGFNGALWTEEGAGRQYPGSDLRVGASVTISNGPIDNLPPTAKATLGAVAAGASDYTFTVRYQDNRGIETSSIDGNDILIMGPGGFARHAQLVGTVPAGGSSVDAAYRLAAPGEFWDSADNGSYAVHLRPRQIADTAGNFAAERRLGTFSVDLAPVVLTQNGLLVVNGTGAANKITAATNGKMIRAAVGLYSASFPAATVKKIQVNALGGDDRITITANLPSRLDGGAGDDVLSSSDAADALIGGDGNDQLFARGGNDLLQGGTGNDQLRGDDGDDSLDGGSGADQLVGGNGIDLADYSARKNPLRITVDARGDDGETNERDNVHRSIERVAGGSGNDLIIGNELGNILIGSAGNDTLQGLFGDDTLIGSAGSDRLEGASGNDRLDAKDGAVDDLDGGRGSDRATLDPKDKRSAIEVLL